MEGLAWSRSSARTDDDPDDAENDDNGEGHAHQAPAVLPGAEHCAPLLRQIEHRLEAGFVEFR
jgi:hypothetical protein